MFIALTVGYPVTYKMQKESDFYEDLRHRQA